MKRKADNTPFPMNNPGLPQGSTSPLTTFNSAGSESNLNKLNLQVFQAYLQNNLKGVRPSRKSIKACFSGEYTEENVRNTIQNFVELKGIINVAPSKEGRRFIFDCMLGSKSDEAFLKRIIKNVNDLIDFLDLFNGDGIQRHDLIVFNQLCKSPYIKSLKPTLIIRTILIEDRKKLLDALRASISDNPSSHGQETTLLARDYTPNPTCYLPPQSNLAFTQTITPNPIFPSIFYPQNAQLGFQYQYQYQYHAGQIYSAPMYIQPPSQEKLSYRRNNSIPTAILSEQKLGSKSGASETLKRPREDETSELPINNGKKIKSLNLSSEPIKLTEQKEVEDRQPTELVSYQQQQENSQAPESILRSHSLFQSRIPKQPAISEENSFWSETVFEGLEDPDDPSSEFNRLLFG